MKIRVCTFSCAAALFAAAISARQGADVRTTLSLVALSFIPYAFLFSLAEDTWKTQSKLELWIACAFGACGFIGVAPTLSTDVYRYVWDGTALLHGFNPACVFPNAVDLRSALDFDENLINHRTLSSPYPLGAQLLFAGITALNGSWITFQCVALAVHVTITYLLLRAAPASATRAAYVYGLNPLLVVESAWSAHLDFFVGVFLLAGALLHMQRKTVQSALAWSVAAATKLGGFVPLFWLACRNRKYFLWLSVLGFAVALPNLLCDESALAQHGLAQYAARWSGHTVLFPLFESDVREFLTLLNLDASLAPLVTRAIIGLGLIVFVTYLARATDNALLATRAAIFALLMFSPQFHPWYTAWLLPLEAAAQRRAGFVLSAAMLGTYLPLADWNSARVWHDSALFLWISSIIVVITLILEPKVELRNHRNGSL